MTENNQNFFENEEVQNEVILDENIEEKNDNSTIENEIAEETEIIEEEEILEESDIIDEKEIIEEQEIVIEQETANTTQIPVNNEQIEDFVKITPIETVSEKQNKKGFKIFALLIIFALILTVVASLGYYAGKNAVSISPKNPSLNLAAKPENNEKLSAEQVYEELNKSVVGIAVYDKEGIKGYASGVVYSEDGYIITNDHIYMETPSAKFKIYSYDGNIYEAKFVAGDTRSDLAVLKVDASGFYPATFGNSDELKFGEEVFAIGRPNDATASSSITGGYISFLNRRVANTTSYSSKLIQTDSAINPGSSGGALVNAYGQVVGITSSKLVGDEYEGVGYAIPTTTVKFVVEELINNGTVTSRAKLGVSYTEIDSVTAEINGSNISGLKLAEINAESPLYGKASEGDIITGVNDIKILKGETILEIIEAAKPGDKVILTIYSAVSKTSKNIEVELLRAESTSSYEYESLKDNNSKDNDSKDENSKNNNGTFDFPFGY